MRYLSVHDIVWINSTVLGETVPFDYEKLEACMAAQYRYGKSDDVPGQLAEFLNRLLTQPAFERGNEKTAFVAASVFLIANGLRLQINGSDVAGRFHQLVSGKTSAPEVIAALTVKNEEPLMDITLRALITQICNRYADVLSLLN